MFITRVSVQSHISSRLSYMGLYKETTAHFNAVAHAMLGLPSTLAAPRGCFYMKIGFP